ncbi:MAG: hypothetical protein AAF961_18965 [Planctomycetota bacterium]
MITGIYVGFVLATICGTLTLLWAASVPAERLFQTESLGWGGLLSFACGFAALAAGVELLWSPRPWGASLSPWSFLPFGLYLWCRCIYLLRTR